MKYLYMIILLAAIGVTLASPIEAVNCDVEVGPGKQYTTIQAGVNAAQSNPLGKTVCVYPKDQPYIETVMVNAVEATVEQPFTLTGVEVDGKKPELRDNQLFSADSLWSAVIRVRESQHVIVANFEISRSSGRGIVFGGSDHITIKDNIVHHTFNSAIKGTGTDDTPEHKNTNYSKIDGNVIYQAGLVASRECDDNTLPEVAPGEVCDDIWTNHPETVNIQSGSYNEISNNVIYLVSGGTVSLSQSYGSTIRNNYIFNSTRPLMHLAQGQNFVLENNLVYYTGDVADTLKKPGLHHLDEYYDYSLEVPAGGPVLDYHQSNSKNLTIRNNIVANAAGGFDLLGCECKPNGCVEQTTCGFDAFVIENNTIIMSSEPALKLLRKSYGNDNVVRKNIFHVTAVTTDVARNNGNPKDWFDFHDNVWSKQPEAFFSGTNDVIKNQQQIEAMFVSPEKIFDGDQYVAMEVQPEWFALKSEYSVYGADVSKVGPQRGSDSVSPTPTTEPTAAPSGNEWVNVLEWLRSWGEGWKEGLSL